jgi:hypothetical protein
MTVNVPPALHAAAHTFFNADPFLALPADHTSPVGRLDSAVRAWFARGMAAGVPQNVLTDVIETAEVFHHICGLDRTPFDLQPPLTALASAPPGPSFPPS